MAEIRGEFPPEHASAVERVQEGQWAMLVLMHRYPEALDLTRTSPALMYCLANSDQFRGTFPEVAAIQALFRSHQRQRAILKWLGFPGTEAMAKIMRKIVPEAVNPSAMRAFRNVVTTHEGIIQMLGHVPKIPEGVLAMVIYWVFHNMLTLKLLSAVAVADDEQTQAPTACLLDKVVALSRDVTPSQPPRPFETREQVRAYHDLVVTEWEAEMERRRLAQQAALRERERRDRANARRRERNRDRAAAESVTAPVRMRVARIPRGGEVLLPAELAGVMRRFTRDDYRQLFRQPYPPPPFPGSENITPIASAAELAKEGREQDHCVGMYLAPVLAGLSYVYKVLKPERATLSLFRSGGEWRLEQVRGQANRPISEETMRTVRNWFAEVWDQR
jgi:hypothetical protein